MDECITESASSARARPQIFFLSNERLKHVNLNEKNLKTIEINGRVRSIEAETDVAASSATRTYKVGQELQVEENSLRKLHGCKT